MRGDDRRRLHGRRARLQQEPRGGRGHEQTDDREHDPPVATPAADRRDVAVDPQLGEVGRGSGHGPANEIAGPGSRRRSILPIQRDRTGIAARSPSACDAISCARCAASAAQRAPWRRSKARDAPTSAAGISARAPSKRSARSAATAPAARDNR